MKQRYSEQGQLFPRELGSEPEACVGGKGFLGFGLHFFGGCKELNYLMACPDGEVVPKAFLVKNDTKY